MPVTGQVIWVHPGFENGPYLLDRSINKLPNRCWIFCLVCVLRLFRLGVGFTEVQQDRDSPPENKQRRSAPALEKCVIPALALRFPEARSSPVVGVPAVKLLTFYVF